MESGNLKMTEKMDILQRELDETRNELKKEKNKCLVYEMVLVNTEAIPVTLIAKNYGMGAVAFNRLLRGLGIQYKCDKTWCLYQDYAKQGYTRNSILITHTGEPKIQMCWTPKGQVFLYNFLKKKGILPKS